MTMTASRALPYLVLAAGFVVFSTAFAQPGPAEAQEVDWLQLGMGLFGGLAIFLAGLDVLSEGLKKAAGNTLRTVLQKLTVNTLRAGLSQMHGLRHAYAQNRYEELTGWKAPAAGGLETKVLTKEQRELDREARLIISRELGHEREQVTAAYLGK